jgi:beta-lactamase regulating signal transducer with metallopeptidase domain
MAALLKTLLEMTAMASAMILAVLAVRAFLSRRMHPSVILALWAMVLLRLCLPVTMVSPVHLFSIPPQQVVVEQPSATLQAPSPAPDSLPVAAQTYDATDNITPFQQWSLQDTKAIPPAVPSFGARVCSFLKGLSVWDAFVAVWALGSLAVMLAALYRAHRFKMKLRICRPIRDGFILHAVERHKLATGVRKSVRTLECGFVEAPTVFGHFRPVILLPGKFVHGMSRGRLNGILLHEVCHIKRRDILANYLWLLAKAVHWFNPLVWVAYRQYQGDVELRCDQMVAARLDRPARLEYGQSLIDSARFAGKARRPFPAAAASLFTNKYKVKERVLRLVQPQKRSVLSVAASIALAAMMVFACFTTACQPTPTEPVVIQKNDNVLIEAINEGNSNTSSPQSSVPGTSGAPARYADIPAVWQDAVTVKPFPIEVNINARITVPAADKLPVVEVKPAPISQEQVDSFLAVFGQAPYHLYDSGNQIMTKADYTKLLMEQQKNLTEVDNNPDYTDAQKEELKNEYREAIQKAEKDMLNAPDTLDDVIDPVFTNKYLIQAAAQPDHFEGEPEDTRTVEQHAADAKALFEKMGMEQISVKWEKDGHGMILTGYRADEWSGNCLDYLVDRDGFTGRTTVDAVGDIRNMKMTWEEARALAEKAVASLGLDYLTLARSAKDINYDAEYRFGFDRGAASFTDFGKAQYSERAYVFDFTRSVNGVSETYISNSIDTYRYSQEPPYERLSIVIGSDGIEEMQYGGPCTTMGAQLSGDVKLLDFQKVRSIALDQLTRGNMNLQGEYPPETEKAAKMLNKAEVWIDNVTLGYARIKLGDGSNRYALVPAWDFFGYWAIQNNDENQGSFNTYSVSQDSRRWSILTINAIDGSVIDRRLGY